jgi:hypothetical protein
MNFIVFLLSQFQRSIESIPRLTSTSNRKRQNRHPPTNSPTKFVRRSNLLQLRELHLRTRPESIETPPNLSRFRGAVLFTHVLGMNRDWRTRENDKQCESKSEQQLFRIHDGNRIKTAVAPG